MARPQAAGSHVVVARNRKARHDYHIDQTLEALHQGLTMHPAEQRERMRSLRERVQDFNIYRWAGRMLLDACEERQHEKLRDRIERATGQSVVTLENRAR